MKIRHIFLRYTDDVKQKLVRQKLELGLKKGSNLSWEEFFMLKCKI